MVVFPVQFSPSNRIIISHFLCLHKSNDLLAFPIISYQAWLSGQLRSVYRNSLTGPPGNRRFTGADFLDDPFQSALLDSDTEPLSGTPGSVPLLRFFLGQAGHILSPCSPIQIQ